MKIPLVILDIIRKNYLNSKKICNLLILNKNNTRSHF